MSWRPLERSIPMRNGVPVSLPDEEQWSNDRYVVLKRIMPSDEDGKPDAIHLSIRNQDRSARHDWRDFQRIKNQLAGPEWEAMEIYPAESRLVDSANQYHLFCFPFNLGVGFQRRMVLTQAQSDVAFPMAKGAVQRDPEPVDLRYGGLTKIRDAHAAADRDYLEKITQQLEEQPEKPEEAT